MIVSPIVHLLINLITLTYSGNTGIGII